MVCAANYIEIAPDAFHVVAVFDLAVAYEVAERVDESRLSVNNIDFLFERIDQIDFVI